jgi:hypothetical protein
MIHLVAPASLLNTKIELEQIVAAPRIAYLSGINPMMRISNIKLKQSAHNLQQLVKPPFLVDRPCSRPTDS